VTDDRLLQELRLQLYAIRAQADALIVRVEGALGDEPRTCPHPEESWKPANFGQPVICGLCGEPVPQA